MLWKNRIPRENRIQRIGEVEIPARAQGMETVTGRIGNHHEVNGRLASVTPDEELRRAAMTNDLTAETRKAEEPDLTVTETAAAGLKTPVVRELATAQAATLGMGKNAGRADPPLIGIAGNVEAVTSKRVLRLAAMNAPTKMVQAVSLGGIGKTNPRTAESRVRNATAKAVANAGQLLAGSVALRDGNLEARASKKGKSLRPGVTIVPKGAEKTAGLGVTGKTSRKLAVMPARRGIKTRTWKFVKYLAPALKQPLMSQRRLPNSMLASCRSEFGLSSRGYRTT